MGVDDRIRNGNSSDQSSGFWSSIPPVVRWLLWLNLGIFAFEYLIVNQWFPGGAANHPLMRWGAFTHQDGVSKYQFWRFITFQFLHGSLGHILTNCMGLYYFGPWMERWWGAKKFLIFYLLCGSAGAVLFSVLIHFHQVPGTVYSPIIGASAGIYGIFMGVAIIAPRMRVSLLFPPIDLSMRQFALGILAIAVGIIVLNLGKNQGGEAGHLGGAILGFILVKYPVLLSPFWKKVGLFKPRVKATNSNRQTEVNLDALLEKISKHGFQSLSEKDRQALRDASQSKPENL